MPPTTTRNLLLASTLGSLAAQVLAHPCYDLHEKHCADIPGGVALLDCLEKHAKVGDESCECAMWLKSHRECDAEVGEGGPCHASAYSADGSLCLQDWTPRNQVSEKCKIHLDRLDEIKKEKEEIIRKKMEEEELEAEKLLPEKERKKKERARKRRELEKERKKQQRKRVREEAAQRMRDEKGEGEKEDKKKAKKTKKDKSKKKEEL